MAASNCWHADGTFYTASKYFYQIYVIQVFEVIRRGNQRFSLIYKCQRWCVNTVLFIAVRRPRNDRVESDDDEEPISGDNSDDEIIKITTPVETLEVTLTNTMLDTTLTSVIKCDWQTMCKNWKCPFKNALEKCYGKCHQSSEHIKCKKKEWIYFILKTEIFLVV